MTGNVITYRNLLSFALMENGMSISDFMKTSGIINPATMASWIRVYEDKGLITTTKTGRKRVIELTQKGETLQNVVKTLINMLG